MLGKELVTQSFTSRFSIAPVLCLQYVDMHTDHLQDDNLLRYVHLYTNLNFILPMVIHGNKEYLKGTK